MTTNSGLCQEEIIKITKESRFLLLAAYYIIQQGTLNSGLD